MAAGQWPSAVGSRRAGRDSGGCARDIVVKDKIVIGWGPCLAGDGSSGLDRWSRPGLGLCCCVEPLGCAPWAVPVWAQRGVRAGNPDAALRLPFKHPHRRPHHALTITTLSPLFSSSHREDRPLRRLQHPQFPPISRSLPVEPAPHIPVIMVRLQQCFVCKGLSDPN